MVRFNKGDILYSKLRTYLNKVLVAPQSGYCTTEIMPFNSYCNVFLHIILIMGRVRHIFLTIRNNVDMG